MASKQNLPTSEKATKPVAKEREEKKEPAVLQGIPDASKQKPPTDQPSQKMAKPVVKEAEVKKEPAILQGIPDASKQKPPTEQPSQKMAKPVGKEGEVKKEPAVLQGIPAGGPAIETNGKSMFTNPRSSRIEEKNMLAGLNNRLAGIIDRNRQLESDNLHLNAEVKTTEERLQTVSTSLKTTFEKENGEMRKQLDNAEKDKAKLVLSEKNVRNKLKEAEEKLKKREAENLGLQKELDASKVQNRKLEDELNKQKADGAKLAKDKAEVEDENKKLRQENEDFKKFNEEHLLTQVELQNALKNKGEELNLKTEVHEREIKAISTKSETFMQKIGEKAKEEFEKKLEDAIKHLRNDCEDQMDCHKKEQAQLHQLKEKDLKQQIAKLNESIKLKSEEITDVSSKADKFNLKIAELEGEKTSLEKKVKGAEEKLDKTESKLSQQIKGMEKDLKDLQDDKEKLIGEYQDLMEIKVALDNEIATYRNLLEGEEDRLKISVEEPKKKAQDEKEKKLAVQV